MAIMVMDMTRKASIGLLSFTLLSSISSFAGQWQFDPSIKLDETYSDNVGLTSGNKESSLVSQAGVLLDTSYIAKNLNINLASDSTYALYSHNHKLDNDYHNLTGDFSYLLWPNGIRLFGSAHIRNRANDVSRNALADIVSADTTRLETYNSSLQYNINNSDLILSSQLSYLLEKSEDGIGDREGTTVNFTSQNGTGGKNIFWNISHAYQELQNNDRKGELTTSEIKIGLISPYKIAPFLRYYNEKNGGNIRNTNDSTKSNSYGAGLRWLVSPRVYLDVSYNTPTGNEVNSDGKKQDDYIDAYIRWQPSKRTLISANYSERFFGNTYGLDMRHQNRRLTNTISYKEEVETLTRSNFVPVVVGLFWCPNTATVNSISNCILQDGSTIVPSNYQLNTVSRFELAQDNSFSLNKILKWNSTLALPRTTFTIATNIQKRENLNTRIADEFSSGSFNVKRNVSGNSSLSLIVSYTATHLQKKTPQKRVDRYRRYQLAYDKSLNKTLAFNLNISYLNRSSSDTAFNYQERRINAKITKGF